MQDHRQWATYIGGLIGTIALLTAAACGDTGTDDTGTTSSPTSPTAPSTTGSTTSPTQTPTLATCTNDEIGYTVGYPERWHTNEGDAAPACTYFDPEPVTVEEGTEADTAIAFSRSDTAFATASSPDAFDRVRSRDSATVDGREAIAVVEEASGQGMLDEGTLSSTWLVNLADGTLVATTHDGPERDFQPQWTAGCTPATTRSPSGSATPSPGTT